MERHWDDQFGVAAGQKFTATARHDAAERLAKRDLAAVLEFLYCLPQRMFLILLPWIARPGTRPDKLRPARNAATTGMIVAGSVGKGTPTAIAQRMADPLYFSPAGLAEIVRVVADNARGASATARRVEPIDHPIKTIGDRGARRIFHRRET